MDPLDTTNSISINEAEAYENLVKAIPKNKFKALVVVGRGGLSIAQKLAYHLDIPVKMVDSNDYLIMVKEDELFLDDISCTGDTIGNLPCTSRSAVLVQRESSKFKADYCGIALDTDKYIKFSWEA